MCVGVERNLSGFRFRYYTARNGIGVGISPDGLHSNRF